ncbi:MAG: hypothetical protein AB7H88_20260 [Vicinamibacterales bacterium]
MADEMTLEGLASEMRSLMGDLRSEIGGLRQDMKGEIGGLRQEMDRRFDQTQSQAKALIERVDDRLGIAIEGQIALRESMERRFDDAKREADDRHELLSAVARDLGVRTTRLERTPRKRRNRN